MNLFLNYFLFTFAGFYHADNQFCNVTSACNTSWSLDLRENKIYVLKKTVLKSDFFSKTTTYYISGTWGVDNDTLKLYGWRDKGINSIYILKNDSILRKQDFKYFDWPTEFIKSK